MMPPEADFQKQYEEQYRQQYEQQYQQQYDQMQTPPPPSSQAPSRNLLGLILEPFLQIFR